MLSWFAVTAEWEPRETIYMDWGKETNIKIGDFQAKTPPDPEGLQERVKNRHSYRKEVQVTLKDGKHGLGLRNCGSKQMYGAHERQKREPGLTQEKPWVPS